MKLFSELKRVAGALEKFKGSWALCGGVVASIYRETPRFTHDIDIAVVDRKNQSAEELATEVLKLLKYDPILGFVGDLTGHQEKALICGRIAEDSLFIGVDFLLPVFPWVKDAVFRAQSNLIDYGFSKLPTITVEDLLIAKISALQFKSRAQDIDDVESLLSHWTNIDIGYVLGQFKKLNITPPDWIRDRIRS